MGIMKLRFGFTYSCCSSQDTVSVALVSFWDKNEQMGTGRPEWEWGEHDINGCSPGSLLSLAPGEKGWLAGLLLTLAFPSKQTSHPNVNYLPQATSCDLRP